MTILFFLIYPVYWIVFWAVLFLYQALGYVLRFLYSVLLFVLQPVISAAVFIGHLAYIPIDLIKRFEVRSMQSRCQGYHCADLRRLFTFTLESGSLWE